MSTIDDVARLAGVSRSTLSLVINHSPKVRDATRKTVEAAIAQLEYRPLHAAREMAGKRTKNIGVLSIADPYPIPNHYEFSDCVSTFIEDVIIGIEESVKKTDYGLNFARQMQLKEQDLYRVSSPDFVDGLLILTGRWDSRLIKFTQNLKVPVVVTGGNLAIKGSSCVFVDEYTAAYKATRHLVELGHTRIALINSDTHSVNTVPKFNGYSNCLRDHQIPLRADFVRNTGFAAADGRRAMEELLTLEHPPTAVFCAYDGMAIGAAHAVLSAGLRIPTDIAVMGFEDCTLASHFFPPLSTVHMPKAEIGSIMIQELISIIEGRRTVGLTTLLETAVVRRQST